MTQKLYEVDVHITSTVTYEVFASSETEARKNWHRDGMQISEFVEDEYVTDVRDVDDRFGDDEDDEDAYEPEEYDADDYLDSSN